MSVVSVTTVYVGANADLVRGFITSPLEARDRERDGIDYHRELERPERQHHHGAT
jgi:multidrug efflux pump